jgi:hypothetical protein
VLAGTMGFLVALLVAGVAVASFAMFLDRLPVAR